MTIRESEEDRVKEGRAAWEIELATGCDVRLTRTTAACDFLMFRKGILTGVGEMRHRADKALQYTTINVGVEKVDKLLAMAAYLNCVAMYFFRFGEGEVLYAQCREGWGVTTQSRNKLRDATDKDRDVYMIPRNEIRRIPSA